MDPHKVLGNALTARLGMQMSLSATPVVEEWMDTELTRWLESVPLPMEMPAGGEVKIEVAVASDLQRLQWSAHGTPRGIIPKLSPYLGKCGAKDDDLAPINTLGEAFEPRYVGSWIRVTPGVVTTGWQFVHDFERAGLGAHLGAAREALAWFEGRGIDRVARIAGCLGSTRLELDAVLPVGRGELVGELPGPLSEEAREALTGRMDRLSRLRLICEDSLVGFAAIFTPATTDDAAALSQAFGLRDEGKGDQVGKAVGADDASSVMVEQVGRGGHVLLRFEPGSGSDAVTPSTTN